MNVLPEDFASLFELLIDEYEGDYTLISRHLYRAIYSMHFLNDGDVPRADIQDICFTLYQLSECFYQAREKRHARKQEELKQLLAKVVNPVSGP